MLPRRCWSSPHSSRFRGSSSGSPGAEGISGYLEFDYNRNDTENKDAGGGSIKTKSDTFTQLYSLTFDRKLYPNLTFLASGIFLNRDTSFDIEGLKNDTTTTTLRPYVSLNLRTPLYYAEGAYSRNEEKVKTSGLSHHHGAGFVRLDALLEARPVP